MSKLQTPASADAAEDSYVSKLDIGLATTKRFKRLVELYRTESRVVICGVGQPGVGKSQGVKQVAFDRGVPFPADDDIEDLACVSQVFHVPQMQVEDFYIPTIPADSTDRRYYDRRIPRRFEPVIRYVEENREAIKSGTKGRPVILVEEPNRARDKAVTAALFTMLEDRMIGDTHLSPLIQMVCLMNPSGTNMAVNSFEKDNAARRRLLFVGVTASFSEFIDHAEQKKFHPKVIEFIRAQPLMVYDHAAAQAGKVYPCPASWETVSGILKALDAQEVSLTGIDAQLAVSGKIGMTATSAFFDFIANNAAVVAPGEVLKLYAVGSAVRARVKGYIEGSSPRADLLATLCRGIAATVFHERRDPKSYGEQLALFMDDLMPDMLVAFIAVHLIAEAKGSEGGMDYFKEMNRHFASEPAYRSAMSKFNAAKLRAEEEKNKSAEDDKDGAP